MRARWSLPVFASAATLAFVMTSVVSPHPPATAESLPSDLEIEAQTFEADVEATDSPERDGYGVTRKPPTSTAPAAGVPDPGTAKAIAYEMVMARGWGEGEYSCLVALWQRESGWNVYAHNPSSGAYGIPQALPGIKMASAGPDWATNPATQITWGIGYIAARYGTPCNAWHSSETRGWY